MPGELALALEAMSTTTSTYESGWHPPFDAVGHKAFVDRIIAAEGVHPEVQVVESGHSEVFDHESVPRKARLRTKKGKPKRLQTARLYAHLLGLKSAFAPTGRQFERVLELAKANSPHNIEFQKVKVKF